MKRFFQPSLRAGAALSLGLSLISCAEGGTGTVGVRVWGEGYLEDGVPQADVTDGWKVDFQTFNTVLEGIEIAGQAVPLQRATVDATLKSTSVEKGARGQEIASIELEPGTYKNAAFTLVQTVVEGTAQKDGKTLSFKWVFDAPVRYSLCEATTRVKSATSSDFEITLHADHYLYDSLAAHKDPKLVFGPIAAADANQDGVITQQELQAAPISDQFDTGSQKIGNMWEWLLAQNLTIAHADGEHHCKGELATASGPGNAGT